MKKKIIFLSTFATLSFANAFAQNDVPKQKAEQINPNENIVIESERNGKKTSIVIKDGEMFVDGKKVEGNNVGKNLNMIRKFRKGIKKDGIGETDIELEMPNLPDMPELEQLGEAFGNDAVANKPMLGVSSKAIDANNGAEVVNVTPGSPAEKLGLKAGDIITKVGKMAVTNPEDLAKAIAACKPNENIQITYNRNGNVKEDMATLVPSKGNVFGRMFGDGENPFGSENPFGGMNPFNKNPFESLLKMFGGADGDFVNFDVPSAASPRIGAQVEERADKEGVRISEISENSVAQKAGLKINDVITSFGGTNIKGIDDLSKAISEAKNKKDIVVNIKRGKELKTLYLEIPTQLRKKNF